jgi:hypothetical protein
MAYRKLIINDNEYQYIIGSVCAVIKHIGGKRYNLNLSELTGLSWDDIEHMSLEITPKNIANYIIKNNI